MMKILIIQKRKELSFTGVMISDLKIKKIRACKPKEIYGIVSDNICFKPKKEFKLFVKKLIKGDFLENYILAKSLDNTEDDLIFIPCKCKSLKDTIMHLYNLSLTSDQLEEPTSGMLFCDTPF